MGVANNSAARQRHRARLEASRWIENYHHYTNGSFQNNTNKL